MAHARRCLLTTIASDSHMWNLVFMELFMQERGFEVLNLGCCVPQDEVAAGIASFRPDVVLVSTVNGHGVAQGRELIEHVGGALDNARPVFVIGGKLSVEDSGLEGAAASLIRAGYDAVFYGDHALNDFELYIQRLSLRPAARSAG